MVEDVIKEIEEHEKEIMEEKRGLGKEFEKRIREKGRQGLKELYGKIYREYKEIFLKKEPRYYRIPTAYASQYNDKNNPLLLFLRSDITTEEDFQNYFWYTPEKFIESAKEGEIVPFMGPATLYEGNPFYTKFFEKWYEELGFYPPNANRLETSILADKSFEEYKLSLKEELENILRELPAKEVKYDPSGRLSPLKVEEFFPERLAWFKIVHMDDVVDDVKRLLEDSAKRNNKELFNLAGKYTFSTHQIFTSHIFYSKGGYVVLSPKEDLPTAIKTFREVIKRRTFTERFTEKTRWIFLSNLIIEIGKRVMQKLPITKLPRAETPEEAERIQSEIRKDESIQEEKEEVTKTFNETTYATEEMNLSEIESKYNELNKCVQNLGEIYYERLGAKYKLLSTALLCGVEICLATIHPELLCIIKDFLIIHEGLEEGIVEPIIDKLTKPEFRKRLYGGVYGDLIIPLDIWKLGVKELPVVYTRNQI